MKIISIIMAIITMLSMVGCHASIKHYEVTECKVMEVVEKNDYTEIVVEYNDNLYSANGNYSQYEKGENVTVIFYLNDTKNVCDDEIILLI
jgi:hypothetical protein